MLLLVFADGFGDFRCGFTLIRQFKHQADALRFLLINLPDVLFTGLPFRLHISVAAGPCGVAAFAVLYIGPLDGLGDAVGFLLRRRSEKFQNQFTLGVGAVQPFLFKVHRHAMLLQKLQILLAVDGVSRKPADGLYHHNLCP